MLKLKNCYPIYQLINSPASQKIPQYTKSGTKIPSMYWNVLIIIETSGLSNAPLWAPAEATGLGYTEKKNHNWMGWLLEDVEGYAWS